jgi:hypothetical protein
MDDRIAETPLAPNGLPADSAWLFPEHPFDAMNPERFSTVIMERVLERGSAAQTRWLLRQYGTRAVAAWVRRYGYRRLSRKVFEYWRWVFGIKRYHRPPWERARGRGVKRS